MVKVRILEILERQGHTKYWLYKRMGQSYQNISRIWKGETEGIRFKNLEKLCKVLECTPNDLFEIQFDDK